MFYRIATGPRRIRILLTPVGGLFAIVTLGLLIVVFLQLDKFLGLPKILSGSLNIVFSFPVLIAGFSMWLWAVLHFARVKGTPVPFNPPSEVVTTGPYAYIRNPMLTGIFIFIFGLGILFGSISITLIFTPIFILINFLELRAIEEPELEKRLGKDYLEYKKKIPMFFPRMKAKIKE